MKRIFIGIDIPASIKQKLHGLNQDIEHVKWIRPQGHHITLCFIGEISEDRVSELDQALKTVQFPSFSLHLRSMGVFSMQKRRNVIWAGVGQSQPLIDLHGRVTDIADQCGFKIETRPYTPHVTLGRFNQKADPPIQRFVTENGSFKTAEFEVRDFAIFQSRLSPEGSYYSPILHYSLDD